MSKRRRAAAKELLAAEEQLAKGADAPDAGMDIMLEDVFVLKLQPKERSVRAVKTGPNEVALVSTSRKAIKEIMDAVTSGCLLHGRKLRRPKKEELLDFLEWEGSPLLGLPEDE